MFADLHLVVGSTGAGKSTFARQLAQSSGAVRFAIDEWMETLFGPDRPEAAGYDWYAPRVARCTELIWTLASQLVRVGTPSVLEIGLTERAARQAIYERAREQGFVVRLHVVEAPAAVRWQRVEARNREKGETFVLEVTRDMFDFVETMWQPPDEAELHAHHGERIDTSRPLEPAPGGPSRAG
jgi:predicted kinase